MTQEEKELLLKDLCARVPYHPKGHIVNACNGAECDEWLTCATFTMFTNVTNNCRLYLRPMSSMTEEEKESFEELCTMYDGSIDTDYESFGMRILETHPRYGDSFCQDFTPFDLLNTHHFDYRGLIPMGLALEAPEGMYNKYKIKEL